MIGWLVACAAPSAHAPEAVGQWVWTDDDVVRLEEVRAARPDVVAGVHVATVRYANGAFTNELGLSPTVVEGPLAVVVRLDDDVNQSWDELSDDAIAAGLDGALGRVLTLIHTRPVSVVEVQLDYDAPVRRLARWAGVLAKLRTGSLANEHVWVTSLVAHVREPAYGSLFRDLIEGHVLQVFDTGDDVGDAASVGRLAEQAGLRYRLGVGAFERTGLHPTAHRAWFAHLDEACPAPRCESVWVFPAGRPYLDLLGDSK